MTKVLLTPMQRVKAAKRAAILARWKELTSNPENSREEIYRVIGKEFSCSRSTIYSIHKQSGLV